MEVAVEQVFMHRNPDSALKLGQARGAALCAVVMAELPVSEYAPRAIKQAVVGGGAADKLQVCLLYTSIIALYNNNGMIVNQFLLASSFADTELGHCVAAARGAIAGMTRTLGIRHARLGVRVTGLLVGLLDAPEIKLLASERVLASTTPLQRWAEPVDVAKCLAFLVLDSGYITGQLWVMDGGLTAGGNGF